MAPKVSILVPHFQTPTLTLLCLRLLRAQTGAGDYEVIVVDNGSTDNSYDVLAPIVWIRLLRREVPAGERPARSHGLALNMGVEHAQADRILVMHTDTMVLRADWLDYLHQELDRGGPRCGSVGSWKMEDNVSILKDWGKYAEDWLRRLRGREVRKPKYIRSHCALYRREALATHPPMFDPSDDRSAGEELHDAALAAGMTCKFIPPGQLGRYVRHLNHATMALNEQFGASDPYMPRTRRKTIKRIQQFFRSINADRLLADRSLDH